MKSSVSSAHYPDNQPQMNTDITDKNNNGSNDFGLSSSIRVYLCESVAN